MTRKQLLRPVKENLCIQTFLWAIGLAFMIMISCVITGRGIFLFSGDFVTQQIPFYQMMHDTIRSGNIGWSYTTDLGANIVGSYSFYLLGSPFFWITIPFPSEAVPYLMAPLLMLKFGFAAMFAYIFLRRYVQEQRYAMFGALIYAFSGFGIYNMVFNHFHEAMITFPMMLAAIDMYIYEKRRFAVSFTVFLAAIVNYYFFAGQAVFIFIYWCLRMIFKSYKMSIKEFLLFAFEIITGFLCAGILVVPSVMAIVQNSRVSNFPYDWNAVVYENSQQYVHIIESFFFPPDMPSYLNFAPMSNARWASVAAWLPLFSMVGVLAFYQLNKEKWLRKLIPLLSFIALVPLLNSVFQLFNSMYYARWFYMFTMMLTMATITALDNEETNFRTAYIRTFYITVIIAVLIGLTPRTPINDPETNLEIGLESHPDRFWIWVAIALVSLLAFKVLLRLRKNKPLFIKSTALALSAVIIIYGNVLVGFSFNKFPYKYNYISQAAFGNKNYVHDELKDINTVRSDFYGGMDNTSMYWQIPSIQAFHSIVPGSVMDFYEKIGVGRYVKSMPGTDFYGIRSLLSVKYLFDYDSDSYDLTSEDMPGWKLLKQDHHYFIFENENYIPYGFTYDEYITEKEFKVYIEEEDMHLMLLKTIILTDEQAKKHGDILDHKTNLENYTYPKNEFESDCANRRKHVCSDLRFENNRISAKFTAGNKDELVFFSIPYEAGWTAEVNGSPAEIEKVNIGFMAVRVPADKTSEIIFRYQTPGLTSGAVVTAAGITIEIAYVVLNRVTKRKRNSADNSTDKQNKKTQKK